MTEEKQTTTSAADRQIQPASPTVHDKRVPPEGVVPKQAQAYVIAGLALLILMAVMFSKNHARTAPKEATAPPANVSNDVNQKRIQELEQDLSADQRQTEQQQAQAQKAGAMTAPGGTATTNGSPQTGSVGPAEQAQPPRDPIADAEKALAFKSRFASNLVSPVNAASPAATDTSAQSSPSRVNRAQGSPKQASAQNSIDAAPKHAPEVNIDAAHGRPYVIFEGTTIDTVLTNRLDGEFAGPVKVMATNPIYSRDGQHVLIPAGTFLLGDVQKVSNFAQKRLAVTFHRMIMPDGYSVDLDQFRGLDQIGDTGLKDKVNHHYVQIFGASIALGVIAGAAEATTYGNGYTFSGPSMYEQGVASSLSQSSADVLDRFVNIPPTITIREGHRIKVYITQDMLLPAYDDHDMPGVM
ncbi:MAG TPA: TrbI/VirB10 family protein [Terracidiphilus sp.]|nr:TrbI/VirB10 family protein [Terracidiphilus sp.]HEV2398039.1 TrbI/VirB10 family protein [Candidatus Sulfotelmatobacter sp.]